MKKLSDKQSDSVNFRSVKLITLYYYRKGISVAVKLSAAHISKYTVFTLRVKYGLTSYEDLPPALIYTQCIYYTHTFRTIDASSSEHHWLEDQFLLNITALPSLFSMNLKQCG